MVNGLLALVLFDLGATRSFLFLTLNKRFDNCLGELDCPLEIEIADDCPMRV